MVKLPHIPSTNYRQIIGEEASKILFFARLSANNYLNSIIYFYCYFLDLEFRFNSIGLHLNLH